MGQTRSGCMELTLRTAGDLSKDPEPGSQTVGAEEVGGCAGS